VITEDKNGLIVGGWVTEAIKRAEREAALAMMSERARRDGHVSLAADRNYQERSFMEGLRGLGVIPRVAEYKESKNWPNWLLPSAPGHPGYAMSQKRRRRIEKVFSWIQGVAGLHRRRFRGRRRVDWIFRLAAAAHNLVRMVKLLPAV
jgi:Transposase DDE domain